MSRYTDECKRVCKWCRRGSERITGCSAFSFADGAARHPARGDGDMPLCTAPSYEIWAESNAVLVGELVRALQEASRDLDSCNKERDYPSTDVCVAVRAALAHATAPGSGKPKGVEGKA